MHYTKTLIIGAGLAGLSTGYYLKDNYIIVEKEAEVGGLTKTDRRGVYLFDYTGHWLQLRYPHIRELIYKILKGDVMEVVRKSKIYSHKVFTDYPFQANLMGLPPQIIKECFKGFVESYMKRGKGKIFHGSTFVDYIDYYFGKPIGKHFLIPYNTKLLGVDPSKITSEWSGRFIPKIDLEIIIDGILGTKKHRLGYNSTFFYPASGGISLIPQRLKNFIHNLYLNRSPIRINIKNKTAYFHDFTIKFENLVNTTPLKSFLQCIEDLPSEIRKTIPELRATKLHYINMGINKQVLNDYHWVYFPEMKYPFYRIGCFSNVAPYFAPKGKSSLYIEISNTINIQGKEQQIIEEIVKFLKEVGDIKSESDIDYYELRTIPIAHVIFDKNYHHHPEITRTYFKKNNIYSIGRYGKWAYETMEDALDDGYITSKRINRRR